MSIFKCSKYSCIWDDDKFINSLFKANFLKNFLLLYKEPEAAVNRIYDIIMETPRKVKLAYVKRK